MADLREIWTEIDLMDEASFPPLNRPVLLAEKDGDYRGWFIFRSVKQRRFTCQNHAYTHWRGELSVDNP